MIFETKSEKDKTCGGISESMEGFLVFFEIEGRREGQIERESQAGSARPAQSPMWGSNSQTVIMT